MRAAPSSVTLVSVAVAGPSRTAVDLGASGRPPAGRASGPTTREWPPAAGAPPLDPGDSGMPGPAPRPIAHRRQPDRVCRVQVVRPVGRSPWTRQTRPGRAELARRDATTGR